MNPEPRILLSNGIVLRDPYVPPQVADVATAGNRIAQVGPPGTLTSYGPYERVLDCRGQAVLSGLVNAHTHTFQTVFRGLGDGLPFHRWQQEIMYPLYEVLSPEDAALFSLVGCLENIRSGVTSVITFQAYPNDEEACALGVRSIAASGLRGIFVKGLFGENAPARFLRPRDAAMAECERVLETLDGMQDGLVRVWLGPPMLSRIPPSWIQQAAEIARAHQSGLHIHIDENSALAEESGKRLGCSEVEALERLGVLDERFHAAHCVATPERDLERLREAGAHVMHCPISNLYLGSGVAPVVEMRQRGVNVCLGTDGPASNNNQDMFVVVKMASLLQKGWRRDPEVVPPEDALEMATRAGARAMGLYGSGSLAPGSPADLITVDLRTAHTVAAHRAASALVYSSAASDVRTVIVSGHIVMEDRAIRAVDEPAILDRAQVRAETLLRRAGLERLREAWPLARGREVLS